MSTHGIAHCICRIRLLDQLDVWVAIAEPGETVVAIDREKIIVGTPLLAAMAAVAPYLVLVRVLASSPPSCARAASYALTPHVCLLS